MNILGFLKKKRPDPVAEHLKRWRNERRPSQGGVPKSVRELGIEDQVYLPSGHGEQGDDGAAVGKRPRRVAGERWRER